MLSSQRVMNLWKVFSRECVCENRLVLVTAFPFSVGVTEVHLAQLTITHIMSAHEGEQWRRLRVNHKEGKRERERGCLSQ